MKTGKFIATTISQYLNEQQVLNNKLMFTEKQQVIAQKLFQEVFDIYLQRTSRETYPMIYHCTEIEHYSNIKENGLTNERNYLLEYDNRGYSYGFGPDDEEIPGIACGVNYKDVIDRLYPDPEWLLDIIKNIGNPSKFEEKGIDDRFIYCLWITDILKLDLNPNTTMKDINEEKMDFMVDENMFSWLYVKGKVAPELITIKIHEDLNL